MGEEKYDETSATNIGVDRLRSEDEKIVEQPDSTNYMKCLMSVDHGISNQPLIEGG